MHLPQGRAAHEQDMAAGGLTLWGTKTLPGNRVTLHRSRAGQETCPQGRSLSSELPWGQRCRGGRSPGDVGRSGTFGHPRTVTGLEGRTGARAAGTDPK